VGSFSLAKNTGFDLPGKPNPDVFLEAADILEIKPGNCLVIEDAIAGVEGAKRAGMKCIAVTTTNSASNLSDADLIVDHLGNLNKKDFLSLYLSFAKKLLKAAPKTQHIDKATQIAGQGSLNLPGSQAGQTGSSEQRMQDVVRCLALL
jgi:hypothetical protein